MILVLASRCEADRSQLLFKEKEGRDTLQRLTVTAQTEIFEVLWAWGEWKQAGNSERSREWGRRLGIDDDLMGRGHVIIDARGKPFRD